MASSHKHSLRAWIEDYERRWERGTAPVRSGLRVLRDAKRFAAEWDAKLGEQWGVCAECDEPTSLGDLYMVTDEVWAEYGAGAGVLHPGCLQRRMVKAGRMLKPDDFTEAKINNAVRVGIVAGVAELAVQIAAGGK